MLTHCSGIKFFKNLEGTYCAQLTLREQGVVFPLFSGGVSTWFIWNFSAQDICLFYLFNNLFVSEWAHRYLFYNLGYGL